MFMMSDHKREALLHSEAYPGKLLRLLAKMNVAEHLPSMQISLAAYIFHFIQ